MFPEYFRKGLPKLIRKSNFTRLKKICLQARLPQLVNGVTLLEAAGILISRKKFHTFVDLCRLSLKYGQDYIRSQHLQPGYYDKWLRQEERLYNSSAPAKAIQFDYNPRISLIISLNQVRPRLVAVLPGFNDQSMVSSLGTVFYRREFDSGADRR